MTRPFHSAMRAGQRGISVISAVFLLLLMAGLAAYMANIISATHITAAADIGGSRAYQAARAGVEWAMYQIDPDAQSEINGVLPLPSSCPALNVPLAIFPGHTVRIVQCDAFPLGGGVYTEGSRQLRIFRIAATATALGAKAPGIERRVEVTIEKCRDTAVTAAPFNC